MAVKLPNRIILALFNTLFASPLASTEIDRIFGTDVYDVGDMDKLKTYFANNKIQVFSEYPAANATTLLCPAIYVVNSNYSSMPSDFISGEVEAELDALDSGPDAPGGRFSDGDLYSKTVRIVCVSDKATIAEALSAIVEAYLIMNRELLITYDMHNQSISIPEIDLMWNLFPEGFYKKSVMSSYQVLDTVQHDKLNLILQITVYVNEIGVQGGGS